VKETLEQKNYFLKTNYLYKKVEEHWFPKEKKEAFVVFKKNVSQIYGGLLLVSSKVPILQVRVIPIQY